jgi:DNA-binding transcriptional regulator YdaS (Cro superfamily)
MDKLLAYLNALSKDDRAAFVKACATTEGYLRKAVSVRQRLGTKLCIALERESHGAVACEDLVPDADWAYIRSGAKPGGQRRRKTDTRGPTAPS